MAKDHLTEPHDHDHDQDRDPSRFALVPDEAPDPVETRDPHSHPVPRRSTALLFAVPGLILLVIGVVWMLTRESPGEAARMPESPIGTVGSEPDGAGREAVLEHPPEEETIGDVAVLRDKERFVGRSVTLPAVQVLERAGERTFWIGSFANRTLVVLGPNQSVGAPQPGARVQLNGVLERVGDIDQASLPAGDRTALEGERVVIRATDVR